MPLVQKYKSANSKRNAPTATVETNIYPPEKPRLELAKTKAQPKRHRQQASFIYKRGREKPSPTANVRVLQDQQQKTTKVAKKPTSCLARVTQLGLQEGKKLSTPASASSSAAAAAATAAAVASEAANCVRRTN